MDVFLPPGLRRPPVPTQPQPQQPQQQQAPPPLSMQVNTSAPTPLGSASSAGSAPRRLVKVGVVPDSSNGTNNVLRPADAVWRYTLAPPTPVATVISIAAGGGVGGVASGARAPSPSMHAQGGSGSHVPDLPLDALLHSATPLSRGVLIGFMRPTRRSASGLPPVGVGGLPPAFQPVAGVFSPGGAIGSTSAAPARAYATSSSAAPQASPSDASVVVGEERASSSVRPASLERASASEIAATLKFLEDAIRAAPPIPRYSVDYLLQFYHSVELMSKRIKFKVPANVKLTVLEDAKKTREEEDNAALTRMQRDFERRRLARQAERLSEDVSAPSSSLPSLHADQEAEESVRKAGGYIVTTDVFEEELLWDDDESSPPSSSGPTQSAAADAAATAAAVATSTVDLAAETAKLSALIGIKPAAVHAVAVSTTEGSAMTSVAAAQPSRFSDFSLSSTFGASNVTRGVAGSGLATSAALSAHSVNTASAGSSLLPPGIFGAPTSTPVRASGTDATAHVVTTGGVPTTAVAAAAPADRTHDVLALLQASMHGRAGGVVRPQGVPFTSPAAMPVHAVGSVTTPPAPVPAPQAAGDVTPSVPAATPLSAFQTPAYTSSADFFQRMSHEYGASAFGTPLRGVTFATPPPVPAQPPVAGGVATSYPPVHDPRMRYNTTATPGADLSMFRTPLMHTEARPAPMARIDASAPGMGAMNIMSLLNSAKTVPTVAGVSHPSAAPTNSTAQAGALPASVAASSGLVGGGVHLSAPTSTPAIPSVDALLQQAHQRMLDAGSGSVQTSTRVLPASHSAVPVTGPQMSSAPVPAPSVAGLVSEPHKAAPAASQPLASHRAPAPAPAPVSALPKVSTIARRPAPVAMLSPTSLHTNIAQKSGHMLSGFVAASAEALGTSIKQAPPPASNAPATPEKKRPAVSAAGSEAAPSTPTSGAAGTPPAARGSPMLLVPSSVRRRKPV